MRRSILAAAALALLITGQSCAVRREVRPNGYVVTEVAVGPKAKIEHCRAPKVCDQVSTGWFSQGFAGVLEAAVTAIGLYFGIGG